MNRSFLSSVLLATLGAMGTAYAGTVYVPLPGQTTAGTTSYEVQVSVANTAAAPATVNEALLPGDADGTQRAGVTSSSLAVNPGQTSVVKPGATFSGMLELAGAADFRYSARLVNVAAGGVGVDLPLITSSTVTKANGKLSVQGLVTDAARTVDVALVNLAATGSQCTVSFARSNGSALGAVTTVSLNPLSHRYFTNVLSGLVDASGVADARAQVSCTQDFYSYAVLKNSVTGELMCNYGDRAPIKALANAQDQFVFRDPKNADRVLMRNLDAENAAVARLEQIGFARTDAGGCRRTEPAPRSWRLERA